MNTPDVSTRPSLSRETDEIDRAARFRDITRAIDKTPEQFMASCRELGGLALEHMVAGDTPDVEPDESTTKKLQAFLENNDLRYTTFDAESDDAIHDHPGVAQLIKMTMNARGQRVKQGNNYVPRENQQALEVRSSLSALKLYLYTERAMRWKSRQTTGHAAGNGAA